MEAEVKVKLNKKAHSALILCLSNKVLREVTENTNAARVWIKLEALYMTKFLANKLYLKKKLHTLYMSDGRKISKHIDEFNNIVLDLANIEVKSDDENLALLLLTSLPSSYEHVVNTLLYGREALTLEDMMATLNSKENKERFKAKGGNDEGLYVRGRTDRVDSHQLKGKLKSKLMRVVVTYKKFYNSLGSAPVTIRYFSVSSASTSHKSTYKELHMGSAHKHDNLSLTGEDQLSNMISITTGPPPGTHDSAWKLIH
nr:retrovirus-related Pol polyprotein from transposon TNT 1-94 [Tanacetum cinerariifolium]